MRAHPLPPPRVAPRVAARDLRNDAAVLCVKGVLICRDTRKNARPSRTTAAAVSSHDVSIANRSTALRFGGWKERASKASNRLRRGRANSVPANASRSRSRRHGSRCRQHARRSEGSDRDQSVRRGREVLFQRSGCDADQRYLDRVLGRSDRRRTAEDRRKVWTSSRLSGIHLSHRRPRHRRGSSFCSTPCRMGTASIR